MKKEEAFNNIHDEAFETGYVQPRFEAQGLVCDAGREKESLNGSWHFSVDPFQSFLRSQWYKEEYTDEGGRHLPVDFSYEGWDQIKIPSCLNLQSDLYYHYEGAAVFTREFAYVKKGEDKVILKFGGVNYEAKIFLNKQYLGRHKGGSTPFCVDVTDTLQAENRIIVLADNTRKKENLPCLNFDWFNYGGIYRDVEILRLPKVYIQDFQISLVPGTAGDLQYAIKVTGALEKAVLSIKELDVNIEIPVSQGEARGVIPGTGAKLWSPDCPKLYDAVLTYGCDRICDRVGFRDVQVKGQDIYLNGEKIFLKGACLHEDSLKNGKSVTDEEIRKSITIAKEMNCNFLRLAHYPHTDRFGKMADEMGIMLWEELPVYWALDFSNPETVRDGENQLKELITRDFNRASVICWSVGNENPDTDARFHFMSHLAKLARTMDGTRLISAACLVDQVNLKIADRLIDSLDIIGINEYYGWYIPDYSLLSKILENSNPQKPVVITEFGGDGAIGEYGTADDIGSLNKQADIYEKQVVIFAKTSYIKGTTPWILFDFRSMRRLNKMQKGFNIKGLVSADQKVKKPAYDVMKRFYEGL